MKRSNFFLLVFLIAAVSFVATVFASSPVWSPGSSSYNYSINEDSVYFHNLSENITGFSGDVNFSIDTDSNNIYWTNEAGRNSVSEGSISDWIKIYNANIGNLSFNASYDNQTGFFELPIQATNTTDGGEFTGTIFEFIINATNDAPYFEEISTEYNISSGTFTNSLSASDEEEHYPLSFNFEFVDNCTHADWSGREEGENCSVINLTSDSNVSASFEYDYSFNDVGTYWAYINVSDAGEKFNCPHSYCEESTYEVNQTSDTYVVKFNIFSILDINVSDCNGSVLNEDEPFSCQVNVTTKGDSDNLTISTDADFKSAAGRTPHNSSWFYGEEETSSSGFMKTLYINVTPEKKDVGNWTINFSVLDNSESQSDYALIEVYVNYTESNVTLDSISDLTIYENETFSINATDDDLLIRDYSVKEEQLTFSSNTSWVSVSNPTSTHSLDYVTSTVLIDYGQARQGGDANYSVMITVNDSEYLHSDYKIFNIQVLNDSAPQWNDTSYSYLSFEGNLTYLNLTEGFTTDEENDALVFSYSNDTSFAGFNLTSEGIINFSSTDVDVGQHLVTITVSDGKLSNSSVFNFTINNIDEEPEIDSLTGENVSVSPITNNSAVTVNESYLVTLTLQIFDEDLLVPDEQVDFYEEELTINATLHNLTSVDEVLEVSFILETPAEGVTPAIYSANFTPTYLAVGLYNFTINVTDSAGFNDVLYFNFTVNETNDLPVLEEFSNLTARIDEIFYFDINATDQEDGNDTLGNLTFVLENLTVNGDFLTINSTSGEMNFSFNSTYEGEWEYIVTVNDSAGAEDSLVFKISVYGAPNITYPLEGYVFNWTENTSVSDVIFEVDYSVNNTLLTYEFYLDSIVYFNESNYTYTDLISNSSLRNTTNFTWTAEKNFSLEFLPNFTDETYGLYKNFTLLVFNPLYPELNDSVNWRVNVTHKNQNLTFSGEISDVGPITVGSTTVIDLTEYFEDIDSSDYGANQTFEFVIETVSGSGYVSTGSSFDGWDLTLGSTTAATEIIKVTGYEYENGVLVGNVSSNDFEVEYIDPETISRPSSGGSSGSSGSTSLKHFAMRIIVPDDVIISDENYIEVPFQIVNNGEIDLAGITVSNTVLYNNEFSSDVRIEMEPTYIDILSIGESRDFNLKISADTQKSGKYKATIYANVSSPKFSDWGDFFIELKRINETAAEHVIIFTEKLIAENPECLELTELFNQAKVNFNNGNFSAAVKIAEEVADACEKVIKSNEQIKNTWGRILEEYMYYFIAAGVLLSLVIFIFYVHKRTRFNKYESDEYIK